MEELRKTMLQDEEGVAAKQRFGLFSQPPPLALGDNSSYLKKTVNKGADGKPITSPRNMHSGLNRSGMLRSSYLQAYEHPTKDEYVDALRLQLQHYNQHHSKGKMHENDFKPASGSKTLAKSSYIYCEEKPIILCKKNTDSNGRVIIKPKNILTNAISTIETRLLKPYEHMKDQYERKDQIDRQERKLSRRKMQETMFRSTSYGQGVFSKPKEVYGLDERAQAMLRSRSAAVIPRSQGIKHQTRFKLARRGHGDPIGKYPQSVDVQQPEDQLMSKTSLSRQKSQAWRPGGRSQTSRPTPSITRMIMIRQR